MPKHKQRLLSDPFNHEAELASAFESLNLQTKNNNMAELAEIQSKLAALLATNTELKNKMTELEAKQATFQNTATVTITKYEDITPAYENGDKIQLDAYNVIPEFNGERKIYRAWRSQVCKLMEHIGGFKTHPKYAAALSIIRAKITGTASDILINNNTALNIDAIIDRLDFSYADQRPLYVIEAEMTNIRQSSKSLQEFYDAINQALNMVLTKIAMTYKQTGEQNSLITEARGKAIRTFVTGLNSSLIRTTLYGSMPKSLTEAFAVAQTIQYDNQHMQLESKMFEQQRVVKKPNGDVKPNFNPNFRYQYQQPTQAPKQNFTPNQQQQKPTPMEVDPSKQYVQRNQFQPNNFKREREPSFQYANKQQSSFQHMNKQQRVNHLGESDEIQSVFQHGASLDNNCDEMENADCQSNVSTQESTFLDE